MKNMIVASLLLFSVTSNAATAFDVQFCSRLGDYNSCEPRLGCQWQTQGNPSSCVLKDAGAGARLDETGIGRDYCSTLTVASCDGNFCALTASTQVTTCTPTN